MPTYLVTDKHTNTRVMVEAQRPQGALSVLIADRFTLSPALEAAEAIRYTRDGVPFIEEGENAPEQETKRPPSTSSDWQAPVSDRPPLGVFAGVVETDGLGDGAPEFAEVEPFVPLADAGEA